MTMVQTPQYLKVCTANTITIDSLVIPLENDIFCLFLGIFGNNVAKLAKMDTNYIKLQHTVLGLTNDLYLHLQMNKVEIDGKIIKIVLAQLKLIFFCYVVVIVVIKMFVKGKICRMLYDKLIYNKHLCMQGKSYYKN